MARTDAQIRESMFTAEYADGTSGLVEQWLFNEGTSYVVAGTNPTSAGTYANGAGEQYTSSEQANYTSIWAEAGAFDDASSTLVMAGTTQTISMKNGNDVNNLTINDGSTTSLLTTDNSAGSIDVVGDLTVHGQLKPLTGKDTCLTMKTNGAKFMIPQALALDGTNDYVNCGTSTDYDFTDHFTIAGWAKNDNASTTGNEHIISKYAGQSGNRSFRLSVNSTAARFNVGYNSGDTVSYTHLTLPTIYSV